MEGTHDGATCAAIIEVMRAVRSVGKGQTNTSQGFAFRGIDDVLNAIGPALRDHGVAVKPVVEDIHHDMVQVRSGASVHHYIVRMAYEFKVPHGEVYAIHSAGEAMDAGDKGLSKAMSVAYRVGLIQMMALPTGERDPDHDVYETDEPQGQTYGVPEKVSTDGINQLRKLILKELTSRTPPWTLDQIEKDFTNRVGGSIRDTGTETLTRYLDLIKQ